MPRRQLPTPPPHAPRPVRVPAESVTLDGLLGVPPDARGIVLFAHGSGSSRLSPRNTFVAEVLQRAGLATLLMDLLTEEEERVYATRFDIELLTRRLVTASRWVSETAATRRLSIGYFGASTGAAAALNAAAVLGRSIQAVVSRGGRPDLADAALPRVQAPTLLIIGGLDEEVLRLNRHAYARLTAKKELAIVPGASHLFEEPGALERVAELAAEWFGRYLAPTDQA